ncbi:G-protein coupled receptor moody isoform X2 [Pseudomyrmex gracilis]|uniref:G-protein coupled receptor moody isoform X2 n=2 Tax=Pseudomyrmex gracilis TaxID=219809 RepID=UPI000994D7FD|nr:G-protein coupled receptor moody isoform X2 [Pseudomyrmex gracilis]XP_020289240.1 G-protein coupled receptor moody isoform X2 [Pseudomyrmex gracilis]XP_020289242.1 G-protein coupled receptor moody isoform X2 [Pseudomyrmex gracilis]XP_020289243.1 G-protein coupled receptor moody isoform X2 [Pseudomyrmex gracilis]
MASNETHTWPNGSGDAPIEEVLQDPGSVILFVGYPRWLLHFAAVCCVIFMLIGIPGNFITVLALFRTKKLKNATAVFIMNLSVSDLMFCCFNLPLATSTFWHSSWLHGPLLCRLFPLLRYGLVAVSLFSILAITINRYVMIGHPGLYPVLYKTKYLIPMVLATWIAAFGLLIVTWFERFGRFGLDPVIGSCSILPDVNGRSPKEFLFVLAFLIPCLAIIVCYARIFYIVRETAGKSRGRNKMFKMEPMEVSHDQGSSSTRNQEEELSVLSIAPIQAIVARTDEETNLELAFVNEVSSSCFEQSNHDQQRTNGVTKSTDDPTKSDDPNSGNDYDAIRASLLVKDIPFVDEHEDSDFTETKLFLNRSQNEPQRKSSRNSRGRLEKLASRASFIVESSLQRIAGGDRPGEIVRAKSSPERSPANDKPFRRESKFKTVDRTRINGGVASPRMSAKDRKLLQMILVIFSSFLVCYLPITITKLFHAAIDWRGFNIAGYLLIYLTTCINPVIYVVMSSEYRSAYKYVLLCKRERMPSKRRLPGLLTPS